MWRDPKFLCSCASPSSRICIESPATGRKFNFKVREGKSIQGSWLKITDKEKLGRDIFQHIFMKNPSLKRLWKLDEEETETLHENPILQKHAKNFITFLDVSVRSLSLDGEYSVSLAHTVGKKHAWFKEVSFDAEYWLLFKAAVMSSLDPHIHTLDIKIRWQQFIMFLVSEVKHAFNYEIHRKHSTVEQLDGLIPQSIKMHLSKVKVRTADDGAEDPEDASHAHAHCSSRSSAQQKSQVKTQRQSFKQLRAELKYIQDCVTEEEKEHSSI